MCTANLGGAIYAANYDSLAIYNCTFANNLVFNGFGQNIISYNSKVNLTIVSSTFTSYHNSIYYSDGKYLSVQDISMTNQSNLISQVPY